MSVKKEKIIKPIDSVAIMLNDLAYIDYETGKQEETLDFIANSYKYSCWELLNKMEDDTLLRRQRLYFYAPAMFCFRHYLELKMKWEMQNRFGIFNDNEHKLQKLLDTLKSENLPVSVFQEAVSFVDEQERGNEKQFQYYIAKKPCRVAMDIEIKFENIEKVRYFIKEIDFRLSQIHSEEFIGDFLSHSYKYPEAFINGDCDQEKLKELIKDEKEQKRDDFCVKHKLKNDKRKTSFIGEL